MSDERFEEFLQREAKAYNEPPATVPRDEMWAAVAEARARRAADAVADATAAPRIRRRPMTRYAPWIGMAATLLLGVGIGRFVGGSDDAASFPDGTRLASDSRPATEVPVGRDGASPVEGATTDPIPATSTVVADVARDAHPAARQVASNAVAVRDVEPSPTNVAYGVASQRHLASAEALISVVTAAPRDAQMDSLTSKWAREMLSNTRLLLDSPAGDDQVRRRLLEDLETLLVQLVQRSGGAVDERDLIDRTLQRTQLLTRLRTNAAGT